MLRKLFGKMRKRLAKKLIGPEARWRHLENGLSLKPGDLVSSCRGYNERIEAIEPEFVHTKRGWAIFDFGLQLVSGASCSLMHCCTFPLETKEEVVAYFKHWGTPEAIAWCEKGGWSFSSDPKVIGVMEGKEVFDENGEPLYEFCNTYERAARFPKEFRIEMQDKIVGVRRGGSANYEEAYIEGWASFMEVWPDETNPYPNQGRTYWGFSTGRDHARKAG